MISTIVFSRRGVHLWPKGGRDYAAMFVPSEDQVAVLRDLSVSTEEIAQRVRAEGRIPLWREKRGQILVYGFLPPDLKDIRQGLKIWLAEDYAPTGCSAFFFILGNWVVHGVKEIDDERRDVWRSAVLTYPASSLASDVAAAAADLLLRFSPKEICIAVDGGIERQEQFKRALQSIDVACQPFAALHPGPTLLPLYRHRDYGWSILLSLGVTALLFMGLLAHLLLGYVESARLQAQIADVHHQIQTIQINKNIGYIREPQPILAEMRKSFQQTPSAILDAAARFAHVLGELNSVQFNAGNGTSGSIGTDANSTGLMPVTIRFIKIYDKLLVNQESTTRRLLPQAPWIRTAEGTPEGTGLQLTLSMQISSPANGPAIASATSVFQTLLEAPAEAASPTAAHPSLPGAPVPLMAPSPGAPLPPPPVAGGAK